jgi:two-component system, chemotaxis family, protein-glutamate methylesterase/glutaminase
MAGRDIVVIGGSAGSADAMLALLKQLPRDLAAALLVAYHVPPDANGGLDKVLARAGTLPPRPAEDREPIRHGRVYVARPDRHLLVTNGAIRLTRGPRENRWRPAVDTLFRSAAVTYGSRVVGIVMSGRLDDGTAGLQAVKRCGGVAMIQDPADAEYPEMPQSALDNVAIDHRLPVSEMGRTLVRLVAGPAGPNPPVPPELAAEARIAMAGTPSQSESPPGETGMMCPDCGGPLHEQVETGGKSNRYRCLVGHAWSPATLLNSTDDNIESALWAAVRLFRQRANLLTSLSQRQRAAGREQSAVRYDELAAEALEHARGLQTLAMGSLNFAPPEAGASAVSGREAAKDHQP